MIPQRYHDIAYFRSYRGISGNPQLLRPLHFTCMSVTPDHLHAPVSFNPDFTHDADGFIYAESETGGGQDSCPVNIVDIRFIA